MSLPVLETAKHELTLPSQDSQIAFRPFLVKEEKVLLQAMESQNQKQIVNALIDIVDACTFGAVNARSLPIFDLEYIFLKIRAKSVGEVAKIRVKCPDDNETFAQVELNLDDIDVQVDDSHTNDIMIDEDRKLGIVMQYPTLDSVDVSQDVKALKTPQLFKLISRGIYQIYEGEKTYAASDYTEKDLNEFIESMQSNAFAKVQKFYETMPKLQHEIEVENPKTKVKSMVKLQGLADFFA